MSRAVSFVVFCTLMLAYAEPSHAHGDKSFGREKSDRHDHSPGHHQELPHGKPFNIIQTLIDGAKLATQTLSEAMTQVSLVQSQVDSIDDRLGAVENRVDVIEGDVNDVQGQVDTINRRIAAMQDQIGDIESNMENLQWLIQDLNDQIASNAGNPEELEARVADNEATIAKMKATIAVLQGQVDLLENSKQSRILDSCPAGSAISRVNEDGSVDCEIDDAAGQRYIETSPMTIAAWDGVSDPTNNSRPAIALCPAGTVVMGGGFHVQGGLVVTNSQPFSGSGIQSWIVNAYNPMTNDANMWAYAICARGFVLD